MPTWVSFTGATTTAATGYLTTPGDPANLSDAIAKVTPPVTDAWAAIKASESAIIHAIFATLDANGISPFPGGAYEPVPAAAVNGNFASFDASRLVVDSGKKAADFALAAHNHDLVYAALAHNHNTLYPALVSPSVAGNFVSFSGVTGAQSDSGYKAADFAAAGHNHDIAYSPIGHDHAGEDITSGTVGTAYGGTGAGTFTEGSVVFAGSAGVYTQDNAHLFWDAGNGRFGVGTNTPAALFEASVSDIWANQVKIAARFTHHTGAVGGGAAGMGVRADWVATNDAGADTLAGVVQAEWSDPAAGSEDSILRFYYMKGGALTEGLAVSLNGITVPAMTTDGPVYSASGVLSSEQYLDVTRGGTGVGSLTDHGVLVGSGTGDITALAVGTANYLLMGVNAADPTWGLLTNDNVAASGAANIAWDKLAASTVNAALRTGAGGYPEVVPVNATGTNKFLRQVSSGAPSFEALSASDIPALSYAPAWSGLTVGSLIYANAATTVGEITAVAAGRFLVSNGAGVVPYYPAAADLTWDEANNRLGIGTSAPATRLHLYDENATTNAVLDVLTIDRGVTGAGVGAAGLGAGIALRLETTSAATMHEAGRINAVWEDASNGSEDSKLDFGVVSGGAATTRMSLSSLGALTIGAYTLPATDAPSDGDVLTGHADGSVTWETPASGVTAPLTLTVDDAVTNAVTDVLTIEHTTNGTAAAGFGAGIPFKLENAAGTPKEAASVDAAYKVATNGSEESYLALSAMLAGSVSEFGRFGALSDGYIGDGLRVTAPGEQAELVLRPLGGDGQYGSIYYDNATYKLYVGGSLMGGACIVFDDDHGRAGILTDSPAYPLDVTGDINTTTGYRTNGTAGVSATYNVAGTAGSGTLKTMTFAGGILTGVTTW